MADCIRTHPYFWSLSVVLLGTIWQNEKKVQTMCFHPLVTNLHGCFQDDANLYMVPYCLFVGIGGASTDGCTGMISLRFQIFRNART